MSKITEAFRIKLDTFKIRRKKHENSKAKILQDTLLTYILINSIVQ